MQPISGKQEITVWKDPLLVWIVLSVCAVLIGFVFYDGLREMSETWVQKEEYGHGFLIPVISLFLIWQKKDELASADLKGDWSGLFVLAAGGVLFFLGELSTLYVIIQYSFLVVLLGLCISYIGWRGVRIIWAPLLFLVFMIPLPSFLYQGLSGSLQLMSSELGVAVIRLFGIGVYLEGNVIDLGSYKLQVIEACNGLRYLFPLMSLAFLMAYLYKVAFWMRALVFLSSIPITILMNSFRIGVIGVLVEYWGPSMAEGFLHDFEGWVVFMACMGLLLGEMWLLGKLADSSKSFGDLFNLDFPADNDKTGAVRYRMLPKALASSAVVLLITAIGTVLLEDRKEIIPDRESFLTFPLKIDEWEGRSDRLDAIVLNTLKLSDYILADYASPEFPGSVNFYSAYYDSQVKGESAHSPRACLPGGGWVIADHSISVVPGVEVNGNPLPVNRVVIQKGEYAQLVYYWFQQRGRIITSEYMVKWYLFWDSLTKNRTDGALVRYTAFKNPGEDMEATEQRLISFVRASSEPLRRHIPE